MDKQHGRVKYTYLEAEQIAIDYEEQVPLKEIAKQINDAFHKGHQIRTVSAVKYAVNRWNNDEEWVSNLEKVWHASLEGKR